MEGVGERVGSPRDICSFHENEGVLSLLDFKKHTSWPEYVFYYILE